MEVSFKFNNGETGAEMVAAILALFGASPAANVAGAIAQQVLPAAGATIKPIDNPATGGDDDSGPASAAQFDAEGSPWDARIHSDKRTMTEKNIWRKRKGAPPHQVSSVQAELKAQGKWQGAVVQPAATIPQPPAAAPVPMNPNLQQPLVMPPAAAPVAPPPLPAAPVETPYQKFVNFLASNMHGPSNPAGRFTEAWVSDALKQYGVADGRVQSLEHVDGERIGQFHQAFAQAIGATV